MKIVIAGGTGFIGSGLVKAFLSRNDQVLVLTRGQKSSGRACSVLWDAKNVGDWVNELEGADVILNFSGETIASRWDEAKKERVKSSRLKTTQVLVEAISQMKRKPQLFLSASGSGYYGQDPEKDFVETDPKGEGFLSDVCEAWENEAMKVKTCGVRAVVLRMGMVLEKEGGALAQMVPLFKKFLGGPIGSGKQWISWIHRKDLIKLVLFLIEHQEAEGVFNAATPYPVTMKEFAQTLGKVLKRPAFFKVPGFIVRLIFGEMAAEMLGPGQKVLPKHAQDLGFEFDTPLFEKALQSIL